MPKVYIKTYGCQMNERDSEQVAQMFIERGYTLTTEENSADVVLINTCSVRDQAEQRALGNMKRLRKLRDEQRRVVYGFLGCMAQSRGAELVRDVPHLDLVAGTQKYHKVVDHVEGLLRPEIERQMDDLRHPVIDIEAEPDSQNTIRDHLEKAHGVTEFVSIMQGCNMQCTFCIVPFTRGVERSRPIGEIVDEVRLLAAKGTKEVTLLGQIVNLYGRHEFPKADGKTPFVQLLEAVHAVDGIERIRFTSPHPVGFREDLIDAFRRLPKLASHVHFPLQSGSDRILRKMQRPYKAAKFLEICERMKEARLGISITTDIIVGFPGETEEDYLQTRAVVERVEFEQAYVFRYSPRRNTPAALLDEQIPERVKEERNQDMLGLVDEIALRKSQAMIGQRVRILCEGPSRKNAERLTGRTSTNRIVIFQGNERHIGQLLDVDLRDTTGYTLYGELVELTVQKDRTLSPA